MDITSSLDQGLPLQQESMEFLQSMKSQYTKMYEQKDKTAIVKFLNNIYNVSRISSIVLANVLYWLNNDWETWGLGEDFVEFAFDHLGYTRTTIDRYIAIGKMYNLEYVPAHLKEQVFSMTMKSLVPIAKTIEQGYEISEDRWETLAYCPDDNSVRKEIRSIKGVAPRKHSMIIMIHPDGEIVALFGDDSVPIYLGYLNVDIDDDRAQAAISRIIENSNILRRDM